MPEQETIPAAEMERRLRDRPAPDLPDHFVLPDYGGLSIANIAPTIVRLFGLEPDGTSPPLPQYIWSDLTERVECVVLLLLDAVGYLQFKEHIADQTTLFSRLARRGRLFPLTSVFPSTTVSALSSIRTGRSPLGHGFLGTNLLLSRQGVLANMLKLAPAAHTVAGSLESWGWDPDGFITAPSLAEKLAAASIETVVHTRLHFVASTLTRILLKGVDDLRGYLHLSDLWINLHRTLTERAPGQPLFVDVYWSGIDDTAHVYGTDNEYVDSALLHFSRSLEQDFISTLAEDTRRSTVLIVTADHGQIATPSDQVVHLPEHPHLRDNLLLPPAGESRAAYLYVRPGRERDLRAYVAEHLEQQFALLETDRALEAGLWGHRDELTVRGRARLGDMILLAKHKARLSSRPRKNGGHTLRGHHGSLTPEEMLVPLLIARLDQL